MKLAIVAAALSGCATIMAGGPDDVAITTNPPGAYIYVDGKVVGQTPQLIELERRGTLGASVRKGGSITRAFKPSRSGATSTSTGGSS